MKHYAKRVVETLTEDGITAMWTVVCSCGFHTLATDDRSTALLNHDDHKVVESNKKHA